MTSGIGEEVVANLHDSSRSRLADRLGRDVADVFAGHHDHRGRAAGADVGQHVHAGAVRQVVVGEDEVELRGVVAERSLRVPTPTTVPRPKRSSTCSRISSR
jgi:hypothetical protein